MATNSYGFILKRYKQQKKKKKIFTNWCAIYYTKQGKEIMIEARPYVLNRRENAKIDLYEILLREPTCRVPLVHEIRSQKKAIEWLEKLIEKY